jgi:lipid-A-disaccharide synthase
VKALFKEEPQLSVRGWGGELMQDAGVDLRKHYRELAFMGFVEVAKNLRTILRNLEFCKQDIQHFKPDALVLVDYPGFNLRIAEWAKKQGIRVFYYISPQVWAWHGSRVKAIKRDVEKMYVILPFEEAYFAEHGYAVEYVGHPLLDVVRDFKPQANWRAEHGLSEDPIIALLPGSRRQEISRLLEVMLACADRFPQFQFVIAGAPSIPSSFYEDILLQKNRQGNVFLLQNQTYDLLAQSHAALVTSGTATLETALFRVPEVVIYKGNAISYAIAKRLVDIKYISLVNLIMDRPLLRELIQNDCNADSLSQALTELLDPAHYQLIQDGYTELRKKMGLAGASYRVARDMMERLHSGK